MRAYVRGDILPFGLSRQDLDENGFNCRKVEYRLRFQVMTFRTRRELLRYYLDINAGGVVHSDAEISRVNALLDEAQGAVTAA